MQSLEWNNTSGARLLQWRKLRTEREWLSPEAQTEARVGEFAGWIATAAAFLTVAGCLTWAALTEIPEITRAEGKVISRSNKQIIQSQDGGMVEKLLVAEGDAVKAGQPLVYIDHTRAQAMADEVDGKLLALKATRARLFAESRGTEISFPPEVLARPDLVSTETKAYLARRKAVDDAVLALVSDQNYVGQELAMLEPMVEKGAVSNVEALRLKRQVSDLALQAADRKNKLLADSNTELLKVDSEMEQLVEQSKAKTDAVDKTVLRAPMNGIVTRLVVHSALGVVQPAAPIMEITPTGEDLLMETKVKPADVAFLRPGLPAVIKLTAYDSAKYGSLKGKVVNISADTFDEQSANAARQTGETYYHVLVKTDTPYLKRGAEELPIIPGMTATVEIRTGEKTVLEFLLVPLRRLKGAFGEK